MWVISALLWVGTSSAGSGIGEEYFQGVETHKPKKKEEKHEQKSIYHRDGDHAAHHTWGVTTESRWKRIQVG